MYDYPLFNTDEESSSESSFEPENTEVVGRIQNIKIMDLIKNTVATSPTTETKEETSSTKENTTMEDELLKKFDINESFVYLGYRIKIEDWLNDTRKIKELDADYIDGEEQEINRSV